MEGNRMTDDNALTLALQIAEKLQPSLVTEVQYELAFDLLRLIRLVIYEDKNSLTAENKALREALERIATTHYRIYDGNKPYISDHDNSYSLGIADGHRLAAKWAEEALATKPTEGR